MKFNFLRNVRTLIFSLASFLSSAVAVDFQAEALRPPSVPLVACDPYFSIWSPADRLTDAATTHWTGKPNRLTSSISVDGEISRVMASVPGDVPVMPQKSVTVWPTRTVYQFASEKVALTLTFMTPSLPES